MAKTRMELSKALAELSQLLDREAAQIVDHIRKQTKYTSELFSTVYSFETIEDRPKELRGKSGVYVFMIRNALSLTDEEVRRWNEVGGAGFKDYGAKELKPGNCLYLGSGKSIYARMKEHFSADCAPASLKLGHKNRQKAASCVRIYAFPLKKEYELHSKLLREQVETRLHVLLSPMAGSSKV